MEQASGILGSMLSVVFSTIPGVRDWFDALEGNSKRVFMLGLLSVVVVALFAMTCFGVERDGFVCTQSGILDLLVSFGVAASSNQVTYMLTPRGKSMIMEISVKSSRFSIIVGLVCLALSAAAIVAMLAFLIP